MSSSIKRNIWTLDPYVYKATASGVNVYDLASESLINYVPITPSGVNSVWSNEQYVYIATTESGIYRCSVSTISGASATFYEYKNYPNITSNTVNYLHGNGNYLCATTISGVDRYKFSDGSRTFDVIEHTFKCYQTSIGDYYYIVNPLFNNTVDLDSNFFSWNYVKVVELSHPISQDDYQFLVEIPIGPPNEIYTHSSAGNDIRVIDDSGNVLPYYIEGWDYVNPPKIWTKLYKDTEKFYIIYGNVVVEGLSSGESVFELFDHFDGDTLSNKWTFTPNNASNSYVVEDSKIIFDVNSNTIFRFSSNDTFIEGILEYYFRLLERNSSYNYDLDYSIQFENGSYVFMGAPVGGAEDPHKLDSRTAQGVIQGTKYPSFDFKKHTIISSLYYQASDYDGELLVASGTLSSVYSDISLGYGNGSNYPDIEIDWMRIRKYDVDTPTYTISDTYNLSDYFNTINLHAVYESGGGYVYNSGQGNTVEAAYISDLYITEGTSSQGSGNVIFLATSWGAEIIEEKRGDEENCEKRIYLIDS